MQDALAAVESLYFNLQQQVGMLSLAATSQGQKDAFMSQYVAARTAYWGCVNKMFHDDDPVVVSLTAQLKDANDKVANAVNEMGNISKVLDDITFAVNIASQLSALVVP